VLNTQGAGGLLAEIISILGDVIDEVAYNQTLLSVTGLDINSSALINSEEVSTACHVGIC
jgi:hypothetical protein